MALCLKKIYSFEQECLDYAQTANGKHIMFLWQEGNFEQTKEKRDERLFDTKLNMIVLKILNKLRHLKLTQREAIFFYCFL